MEAAVTPQGRQMLRGDCAGSEVTPGGAPVGHETCRSQSKWHQQGREQRAERQERKDRSQGQRLPPCTDGDSRPAGYTSQLQDGMLWLAWRASARALFCWDRCANRVLVPRLAACPGCQWVGPDDILGLVAAICLLFASKTSPQSVTFRTFSNRLRAPAGVVLRAPLGPSAGLHGCLPNPHKLSLKTLLSLQTPSGHKFRGLSKSFKNSLSERKAPSFLMQLLASPGGSSQGLLQDASGPLFPWRAARGGG